MSEFRFGGRIEIYPLSKEYRDRFRKDYGGDIRYRPHQVIELEINVNLPNMVDSEGDAIKPQIEEIIRYTTNKMHRQICDVAEEYVIKTANDK
jgi:hypothetical protein